MREKVKVLFEKMFEKTEGNTFCKTIMAIYLFDFLDRLRIKKFPKEWYLLLEGEFEQIELLVHFFNNSFDLSLNNFDDWNISGEAIENVEFRTGKVYFNLWKNFKKEEYFQQTKGYLRERFEKNGISCEGLNKVLDDGCGGGRYSLALKSLGCKNVTGIDISPDSVKLAKKMNPYTSKEVKFLQGSVLELPFEDESFDFVFSNGVLHHTTSTEKGLDEIYRVMKSEAQCWLYLYGGKETLFWDIVDFSRKLLLDVPQNYTQTCMRIMGYPPGRIFHRTDFFYVPINRRYFVSEMDDMLKAAGFRKFEKLNRGMEFDWDEIIYNNPQIDPYIYGEGEMKYLLTK